MGRKLLDDWPIKLVALGLAVLVWLYANSVVIRTREIWVPVEVNAPATVDVSFEPLSRRVRMTLSGPTGVIEELSRRNVRVVYSIRDVEDLQTDRVDKIVVLRTEMVMDLPSQVQVEKFEPANLELTLRSLDTIEIGVKPPQTSGSPASGFEVGRTEIRGRSRVTIAGPTAVLRRIRDELKAVDTQRIDVSNRSESIKEKVPIQKTIQLDNDTVERVRCDDLVEVFIEIQRASETKVVQQVPIAVLSAPEVTREVEITSGNPIDLTVEGPPELVKSLSAAQLYAFIDIRQRTPEKENDVPFQEKLIVEGLPDAVKLSKEEFVTVRFKLPGMP